MWESILGILKSVRHLKVVLFAYSVLFLLFLKLEYVQNLFQKLSDNQRNIFELSGLFSLILSALLLLEMVGSFISEQWKIFTRNKVFKTLTRVEKEMLRGYVIDNERTRFFRFSSGEVNHLVALNILYRASTISRTGDVFAYNIQEWALTYLQKNPDFVAGEHVNIDQLSDPYDD